MTKLLVIILLAFGLSASAQKDTTITDSTELITIKQVQDLEIYFRSVLTVNEYNKVYPSLQKLVDLGVIEWRRKRKLK